MSEQVTGGYVRHRDRMIQESVFEDLRDTLIACRWLAGTTARPVSDPYGGNAWRVVTTTEQQTLPLLEDNPIVLIDYFPEAEGRNAAGEPELSKTALNTFALDNGTRVDSEPRELGNPTAKLVLYRFNMAFFAANDAVAQAVLNDLADRYEGRLVRPDFVELWNYNSADPLPVVRMSCEGFEYTSNTDAEIAPQEVHLYFAELLVLDEVD